MARQSVKPSASDPCVFCRVASRELPAQIVFEDEISIAFLDSRPLFPGHCLLIPKTHYETLADIPGYLIGPLFSNVQRLDRAVKKATDSDGTFIGINNAVSQSVPHFHIHVVPRRRKDGLRGFFWPRSPYASEDAMAAVRDNVAAQLKE